MGGESGVDYFVKRKTTTRDEIWGECLWHAEREEEKRERRRV